MSGPRKKLLRSYEVKAHHFERVETSMILEAASAEKARELALDHLSRISDDCTLESVVEIAPQEREELETHYQRRLH
ncbi:hypothetical protein DK847_16660 [Aestuariivirga litoralis]|uniref:Uncharacterized protein n=1 Tax=Aestuariivirga litoralis TaxID=2650924 RepID=A0A2W2AKJ0_9HYPH|nr:hypothetical protein [Aestuariivirga litoralis]PZF75851.1 hypothetical protein DK847_16660 [Aestuariivirga litoralis]